MTKVYVDDCRDKPDGFDFLFRSYEEALPWIKENWVCIDLISFDHDMGYDITGTEQYGLSGILLSQEVERMNGHQAVKKLFEWWRETAHLTYPRMISHSANSAGRENILGVVKDFARLVSDI